MINSSDFSSKGNGSTAVNIHNGISYTANGLHIQENGSSSEIDIGFSFSVDTKENDDLQEVELSLSTPSSIASKISPDIMASNVSKQLSKIMATDAANRICADCRVPLVDLSKIYVSFYDPVDENGDGKSPVRSVNAARSFSLSPNPRSFLEMHEVFAPKNVEPSTVNRDLRRRGLRAKWVDEMRAFESIGHAVFICDACAQAHKRLGNHITEVKSITTGHWSQRQLDLMKKNLGNAESRVVLEQFIPSKWKRRIPNGFSPLETREVFARAKYETLAFVLPHCPLGRNLGRWEEKSKKHLFMNKDSGDKDLPSRLVDCFCIVSPTKKLEIDPKHSTKFSDLSEIQSINELCFGAHVSDSFPESNNLDSCLPPHLEKFVFPDGCRPSATQSAPTYFSFTLTSESGSKIYGGALRIYDEMLDNDEILGIIRNSGYDGRLPSWLSGNNENTFNSNGSVPTEVAPEPSGSFDVTSISSDVGTSNHSSDSKPIFLPKSLVVLSHYGFFDLWRKFLTMLYRISLAEAPLPIERYIANFVREVPLPPHGRIEVKFGFTQDNNFSISRPPINRLPHVGFSYRPLFSSLSISNIMVVMGCLMEETQTVLVSKHYGLLSPVAEALLSLLFPFIWQGLYIPVTPDFMKNIIEAPVPFLIGLHSRYLEETPFSHRPAGVVFVDLDEDVVHLGCNNDASNYLGTMGNDMLPKRIVPALPDREAAKLKASLDQHGSSVYISSGEVGRITSGPELYVVNSQRESYCQVVHKSPINESRKAAFSSVDNAFIADEHLVPIDGFATDVGVLSRRDEALRDTFQVKGMKINDKTKRKKSQQQAQGTHVTLDILGDHLSDGSDSTTFSPIEIRKAFLRFFVSIFQHYEKHLKEQNTSDPFDSEKFLNSFNENKRTGRTFVAALIESQMFSRFIQERLSNPDHPDVVFFNDSIIAKKNRSKKKSLISKRKQTLFLLDNSGRIMETFIPPPPSNWGLPGDSDTRYHYSKFPKLNPELFGKTRTPKRWEAFSNIHRNRTTLELSIKKQNFIISNLLLPSKKSLSDENTFVEKDSEWAIHALAYSHVLAKGKSDTKLPSHFIQQANNVINMTRRKQALLVAIITKVQSLWRMDMVKRFPLSPSDPSFADKNHALSCHTFRARKNPNLHELKSAVKVQKLFRAFVVRNNILRFKISVRSIQSSVRGRKARLLYNLVLKEISKVQAQIRGFVVRRKIHTVLKHKSVLYREQISQLWRHAKTPLAYRSAFWGLTCGLGFIKFALIENELGRLWKDLGVEETNDDTYHFDSPLHELSPKIYSQYSSVQATLLRNESAQISFPAEDSGQQNLQHLYQKIRDNSKRLQLERLQVYERIKQIEDIDDLYNQLKILKTDKNKKMKLSCILWGADIDCDMSESVFRSLFPELKETTNVVSTKPSKKGLKNFGLSGEGLSVIPSPLDKVMRVETKIDLLIIDNLTCIGNGFVSGFNSLAMSASEDMESLLLEERQIDSIFFVQNDSSEGSKSAVKLEILQNFVSI